MSEFDTIIKEAASSIPEKPLPPRKKPPTVVMPLGPTTAREGPLDLLDPRERKFVELYCETGKKGQSALVAGYGSNLKVASTQVARLLAKARVQAAIQQRNSELMLKYDLGPDRIIRRFAQIAMTEGVEIRGADVLKALEHLAKIAGMFPADRQFLSVDGKVEHAHSISIEELDGGDRDKLREVLTALKAKQIEAKPE